MQHTIVAVCVGAAVALSSPCAAETSSLKTLAAQKGVDIGAGVVSNSAIVEVIREGCAAEPLYCSTLSREYNMIVVEEAMKFDRIHPAPGVYDFSNADAIVAFAQANGIKVRGHTLVWYLQLPSWITNSGFTGAQLESILREHIATVVGHFRDRFPGVVTEWDVLNEGTASLGVWGRIGDIYKVASVAFGAAREADPDAKLFYNNFSNEVPSGKYYNADYVFVKTALTRGIPIDGIGFQGHYIVESGTPSMPAIADNMKRYKALGVDVKFTELDVRMTNNSGVNLNKEADIYRAVVTACVFSRACTGVITWGFTDKYSWLPGYYPGTGYGLPFDDQYNPKPAYCAMAESLGALPQPPLALSSTPVRINSGGPQYVDTRGNVWKADGSYTGGGTFVAPYSITGTSDPQMYRYQRWGYPYFYYNFAVPNGTYSVTLKFAEAYVDVPGKRRFNVDINGSRVLTDFDIFAAAGAKSKAVDRIFDVDVADGQIVVQFSTGAIENPTVSGIEILQTSTSPPGEFSALRVNAGGSISTDAQGGAWQADMGYSGGTPYSTSNTIAGQPRGSIYHTVRYSASPFSYQFSVPNGTYNVNLKFAEVYFTAAGRRVFHVAVNGAQVLTNFDIVREAGGGFRPLDIAVPVVVADERIVVTFTPAVENPAINAIEITAAQ